MKTWILAFAAGAVTLGLVRFAAAPLVRTVHHHANWAVVVDGERLDLSGDRFMEEIGACAATDAGIRPAERIHMHENNPDVVHVHHAGSTWGQLLANLDMTLRDDLLVTADGTRYPDALGPEYGLVFILNGLPVPSVHNRVVASEDRLLVSVTREAPGAVREAEFPRVASSAGEYNGRMDPSSCSGGHGELPFLTRLRLAFWG